MQISNILHCLLLGLNHVSGDRSMNPSASSGNIAFQPNQPNLALRMEVDDENSQENSRRNPLQRKVCYRNLLNKVEAIQETDNVGIQTVRDVGDILREANTLDNEVKIEERIDKADEILLDCLVLSSASGVLKRCIEAVDVFTSTYDSSEFANKIIQDLHPDFDEDTEINLLGLIKESRKIIGTLPAYRFVYGGYDLNTLPVPKQKKERVKVHKEKLTRKEPEKVTNVEKDEEGIEQIVKVLYDVLAESYVANDEEPIGYYDYIIDTSSYANTVENMFYFAFLIRDGRAKVDLNKRGTPIVTPLKKRDLKAFREQGGKNSQIISSITMDRWESFKKEGLLQQHRRRTKNV